MIIITDIDHTVADALWRDHLIQESQATANWDRYFMEADKDEPVRVMIDIVRHFSRTPAVYVVGLTGRADKWRMQTMMWMRRQGVELKDLLMRPTGDVTPTAELKVRLIKENISDLSLIGAVFEDRSDCVSAFNAIGLRVIQYHDPRRTYEIEKIAR